MKDEQIGKFISKLMKQHKISREELGSKINVSANKIKKYEQGNLNGNIDKVFLLCEELDVSINQLVMGKKKLTNEEVNESFIKILKYQEKKSKRLNILVYIIPLILVILTIPIFMFLHENRDLAYELNSDTENFKIEHCIFIRDNGLYYLIPGQLTIKNSKIKEDNISDVTLMGGDRLIYSSNRYITEISTESKGYDELFPKEVVKNVDNWYYEITYSVNGETKTEIIKFKVDDLNK